MQKVRLHSTDYKSPTYSPPEVEFQAFKSVCHRQTQHLLDHLPLCAVWLVCRHPDNQQPFRYEAQQHKLFDTNSASLFYYLKSEKWLQAQFPPFKLIQLVMPAEFNNSGLQENENTTSRNQQESTIFVYVYFFNNSPAKEYLLLYSRSALSQQQQHSVEQQAELLNDYLIIYRKASQQQQQIELLKQAAGSSKHQLRNPLALIALYAENLCLGLPEGVFKEQASVIRQTVGELSENLNNLYKIQPPELRLKQNDLLVSFRDALQLLQPILQEKQLLVTYPETSVTLFADSWQIKQVFENLLSNAIYFSPLGTTIECRWRVFKNEVLVEISDGGPGLSPQDLKELFVPFYTRRPGGTGLGLSIAKKIIQDHKGSIWAENINEGGAQFSFTLPRPSV
ncbi:HAMP domain-containing histidine kinase [Ancylothrix sp. C2]|uniref:sensor histidine kinase n=1 Tax=Ancylothrix sp. D3o TaxID=2953691 RepID=UPI0021BACE51|nr:HAMP domain-containing sensor histidine kinase [Ancylothrix sp. D3o]MCT7948244.1 HAMP domain-containing histidine kinase [Ancylothrix sp. D3o]